MRAVIDELYVRALQVGPYSRNSTSPILSLKDTFDEATYSSRTVNVATSKALFPATSRIVGVYCNLL